MTGELPRSLASQRIAVATDNRLLCESAVAAVHTFKYDAMPIVWPDRGPLEPEIVKRIRARGVAGGVVFGDFHLPHREAEAIALITASPIRWVLCVADPSEHRWADFVRAGVSAIVPTSTTLVGLVRSLERVLAAHPSAHSASHERLTVAWTRALESRSVALTRFASLTPREALVLDRLYNGISTKDIAAADGVSLATVRTQIKAILRKLDVHSQLAAVREYRKIRSTRAVGSGNPASADDS